MENDDSKTIAELRAEIERLRAQQPNALTGKLSASKIAKLKKRGEYGDGGNLWIAVNQAGSRQRSWVFRWTDRVTGKQRRIGLGSLRTVSINQARELALHYRQKLLEGKDPRAEHDAAKLDILIARKLIKTVGQVANEWFDKKIAKKSLGYRRKIENQLNKYVHPTIGDWPIKKVDTNTILETVGLGELWEQVNPTAKDVQQYLDRIFQYAIRRKYCNGNPASWDVLQDLLPAREDVYQREPRPSLSHKDVGRFLQVLRSYEDRSDRKTGRTTITYLLEFVVLTGVRISEVILAQWKEFDFASMTWNVPPEHRKHGRRKGKVRPVPITKSMMAVLDDMQQRRIDLSPDGLVFPSSRTGETIKTSTPAVFISNILKWETKITPHGFRSTLRDWIRAETNFKDVLWKAQVDHQLGDGTATDEAYGRDLLLEQRRSMMEMYDEYCSRPRPEPKVGTVIKLKRRPA
jgi:integrase